MSKNQTILFVLLLIFVGGIVYYVFVIRGHELSEPGDAFQPPSGGPSVVGPTSPPPGS